MTSRDPSDTPIMQQYRRYKSQYPDTLLFFRIGDFYELFYEDALEAARLLSLTLTSRQKGENAIPMAGVPHHAADGYIRRVIEAGRRVAICEQMQDPREAKGLLERDVVRVISPGALTEDSLLDAKAPNYLAALCPAGAQTGIAWVDFSTGLFQVEDIPTAKLLDELARIAPAECLMPQSASNDDNPVARVVRHDVTTLLTPRPDWTFNRESALRALQEHFGVQTLEGFGCAGLGPSLSAAGAALAYLQETQKAPLDHLRRLSPVHDSGRLLMDRPTRLSLELTRTLRDGKRQGTLLHVLDRTLTPMGGRLLAEWIHAPLCSPEPIRARLAAVQNLAQDAALRRRVGDALRSVYDIERLSARISVGRASPRDLLALKNSLGQIAPIKEALAAAQAPLLVDIHARLDPAEDARAAIATALSSDPPLQPRDGGVFRDGYSQELDELRAIQRDGKGWIARFQAQEAERAGISSLKVGFNKVFGYYIEISNAHASRVPADYLRKQTLTNAERYITPQLKEYETKVLTAGERASEIEVDLFLQLRAATASHTPRFQATAAALAELDTLASLAAVAVEHGYCRPEIADEPRLDIRDGRHPVIERILGQDFVPNDIVMDESARMLIITGPNMAGKSTYIRQAALLVLMAQMGSFVPARSAVIGVADRIFTRVGAADEIARGQSTFMVEMIETANILNNATPRSLLILDEVGRGTSTFDGLSIAWAVAEFIHQHLHSRALFATHYHELTELAQVCPGIQNLNVAVREWRDQIVFLRKIVPGGADKSYGLHVARLAGIPPNLIDRAREILASLESMALTEDDKPRLALPTRKQSQKTQLRIFTEKSDRVLDRIRGLDISSLTPLQALNILEDLKREAL